MPLNPGQQVGSYTVVAQLGSGGMATVYKVRHVDSGEVFALKVLDLVTDELSERFASEGRFQAELDHPNIVAVHEVLEVEGRPALRMAFVDGPTLSEWAQTPRTGAQLETVFRAIVEGIRAAHSRGLVHRDLKPANVLMDGDEPRIADFGIAKDVEAPGLTRTGMALGTPGYMAPEQIRQAKDVDSRADVFALGVLLYQLFCGVPPFRGKDTLEVLKATAGGIYAPPERLQPDLPEPIRFAIEGCLRAQPDRRLPDCDALLEVLDGQRTSEQEQTWSTQFLTFSEQVTEPSRPPVADLPAPSPSRPSWVLPALAVGALGVAAFVGFLLQSGEPGPIETVLVRPLQVSGDRGWLGDGLAEDLTFAVASAEGPVAISQSALDRYAEPPSVDTLRRDLDVDAVVEGSISADGGGLEVRLSLVRTADASVVWSQTHAGPEAAVVGPTGRAARALLEALGSEVVEPDTPPERALAWTDYVQGREIVANYDRDRYPEAEQALGRALDTDPSFVDARALLVRLMLQQAWYGSGDDLLDRAETEVRTALEQDPDHPRALQALGRLLLQRGQLLPAFQALDAALQADPTHADTFVDRYEVEMRAGAWDLARRDLDLAVAADPYAARPRLNLAWLELYEGHDDAVPQVIADAGPNLREDHELVREVLAQARMMQGDFSGAAAICKEGPCGAPANWYAPDPDWLESQIIALDHLGPTRPNGLIFRARAEVLTGRDPEAFRSLGHLLKAYPGKSVLLRDPLFDRIRSNEEFTRLVDRAEARSAQLADKMGQNWRAP